MANIDGFGVQNNNNGNDMMMQQYRQYYNQIIDPQIMFKMYEMEKLN
jgi:hypothetical protein